MGRPTIQAATVSIGANSSENLPTVLDGPYEVVVRAASSGVFISGYNGGSFGSSTGYELNANQEYRFTFQPTAQLTNASADYAPHLWNSTGSAVTVSYVATAKG